MGVEDRDWYHDRKKQKPINPDWQREYNRWYGKPNTPTPKKPGMHWTLTLMCWATFFLAVYIGVKYIMNLKAPVSKAPIQTAPPTVANTTRQPAQPQTAPARSITPAPTVHKCEVHGHTIYTEEPCQQAVSAIVSQASTPPTATANATQPQVEDSAAAARRADEQLARQWDARMEQRDRDIATEQVAVQKQASAITAQCNQLRAQRDNIQRMAIPVQQYDYWRNQMNAIRMQMSQLHC